MSKYAIYWDISEQRWRTTDGYDVHWNGKRWCFSEEDENRPEDNWKLEDKLFEV